MPIVYVVVDRKKDWEPYYPSSNVITFEEYAELGPIDHKNTKVINLCRSYSYLSKGYYTSLLAEARGHKVIPSVKSINDLRQKAIYGLQLDDFSEKIQKAFTKQEIENKEEKILFVNFGTTPHPEFSDLGWKLFENFPFPILQVKFSKKDNWRIASIRPGYIHLLEGKNEDEFAKALEKYDEKVWRKPRSKKTYRYDLAILHNPEEVLPPSNRGALKKLIKAAKEYNIDAQLITKEDLSHIGEYDGLFIRETTAINHYTYTFSRKAESEGLIVIDSPASILRCGNKVYLHELLRSAKIKTPETHLLNEDNAQRFIENKTLDFPIILKIPDGSFSSGIYKVNNKEEFSIYTEKLFDKSEIILAQEYMYTDFDWRVGVLNKKPLFSCRYMMSKNHWQIYNRDKNNKVISGDFEALSIRATPKTVISTALKATQLIGDGLYGVDLKEKNGQVYVIEINDNPNIDEKVEDAYLGDDLYSRIMEEFFRRFEKN